jgi:hypothetical protein
MRAAMRSTGRTRANFKDVATNASQHLQTPDARAQDLELIIGIESPAVRLCSRCGCIILRKDPHAKTSETTTTDHHRS